MMSRHCSRILSLTGFMGCGKSTVGRLLAEKCGAAFIDLDSVIESKTGCLIPEIFEKQGEEAFRILELEHLGAVLEEIPQMKNSGNVSAVLSLGGGTLTTTRCAELITASTFCIYLKASPETLLGNLKCSHNERPVLKDCNDDTALLKRISGLLEKRSATYEKTADLEIITDGKSPEDIVAQIIAYI